MLPLTKDTVSFKSRAELIGADMVDAPNNKTCILAANNAVIAQSYLQKVLDKYISPFKQSEGGSIFDYNTRTKTPSSIREKVVSKYSKICSAANKKFSNQVAKEIIENFETKKGVSEKDLSGIIKNTIEKYQYGTKIAPYKNIKELLSYIINTLDGKNIININENSIIEHKRMLSRIINKINANQPEEFDEHYDNEDGYINPTHIDGVKHYANDIVGARIIMKESDKTYVTSVLKALERAVENGDLKITSIQNNIPEPNRMPKGKTISDYEYASEQTLEKLAKKAGAKYKKIQTKTGYLGIHINVDLSDDLFKAYNGVFNGYSGEIQIIGRDVLQLKEVEDLCYKIKDNKNAINSGYEPFRNHFLKYYSDSRVKKAFDDYTYDLYLAQRSVPPNITRKSSFPSFVELGYNGRIPQELDFNQLAQIKNSCDKIIKNQETEKEQSKDTKSKDSKSESMRDILRNGNINTLNAAIDYQLK